MPHRDLKIFYTNACSLFNKLGEVKCIVNSSDIDIIFITETHFCTEYFDAELAIPNYRIFRNERDTHGGGSCIYVHMRYNAQILETFSLRDSLGVKVFLNSGDVNIVCLYRSPSSTEEHDIAVSSELHKLPISDIDQVILVGDFNLPDVCWSNGTVRGPIDTSDRRLLNQKKCIDCFVSCGLTWHITDDITRRRIVDNKMQESTLDQILTSDSDIIKQFTLGPPLRGSDHLTAILEVKLYDNVEYLASKKFNWAKCDVPRLISTGRQIDWFYSEEALHCVDIMCGELESKILHAIHHSVPILVQKTTKEGIPICKVPWEGSKLRRARKEKNNGWQTFNISPSHFNLTSALEFEKKYKFVEQKLKEDYEKKLSKNVKQNPSKFFAYLRNKKKSNKTVSCLRKANGQTTTCPKETADLLVESFASVFTREEALNENCVLENMAEQINEFTVGKEEVAQQLNSLNIHKAAGPDSLHPVIIKTLAENENFVNAVTVLFQAVARTCCIPNNNIYKFI